MQYVAFRATFSQSSAPFVTTFFFVGWVFADTTFGSECSWRCNTGYQSSGSLHRVCQATGAWSGTAPQVMPLWVSYTLYRFESNVRSASVVGMVGAGGIGVILYEVIRSFQYAHTAAVMLIIIAFVTAIDLVSARIRKVLI